MELVIKGKTLTITANIDEFVSKSGKSRMLYSTRGNLNTGVQYKGESVIAGINIYIPNKDE